LRKREPIVVPKPPEPPRLLQLSFITELRAVKEA